MKLLIIIPLFTLFCASSQKITNVIPDPKPVTDKEQEWDYATVESLQEHTVCYQYVIDGVEADRCICLQGNNNKPIMTEVSCVYPINLKVFTVQIFIKSMPKPQEQVHKK